MQDIAANMDKNDYKNMYAGANTTVNPKIDNHVLTQRHSLETKKRDSTDGSLLASHMSATKKVNAHRGSMPYGG